MLYSSGYVTEQQTTDEIPIPVLGFPYDITDSGFTVEWSDFTEYGITQYKFDLSTDENFETFVTGYNGKLVEDALLVIVGIDDNVTYYFRVRAVVSNIDGDNSSTGNVTTLSAPEDYVLNLAKYGTGVANRLIRLGLSKTTTITITGGTFSGGATSLEIEAKPAYSSGSLTSYYYVSVTITAVGETTPYITIPDGMNIIHGFQSFYTANSIAITYPTLIPYNVTVWVLNGAGLPMDIWESPAGYALPVSMRYLNLYSKSINWKSPANYIFPDWITYLQLAYTDNSEIDIMDNTLPSSLTTLNISYTKYVKLYHAVALPADLTNLVINKYYHGGSYRTLDLPCLYDTGLTNPLGTATQLGTLNISDAQESFLTGTQLLGLLTNIVNKTGNLPYTVTLGDYGDDPTLVAIAAATLREAYGDCENETEQIRFRINEVMNKHNTKYLTINAAAGWLDAPVASAASSITSTSFQANWAKMYGATTYKLDVATDSGFTTMVTGYDDLDCGDVALKSVTGLSSETQYWYRVRAATTIAESFDSNTITVTTS